MKNLGIRKQVLLLGILPGSLIGLLLYTYFITSQLDTLDELMKSRGLTIAEQLASASEYGVITGSKELLARLTTNLLRENDVTGIRITDSDDNTLLNVGNLMANGSQTVMINKEPAICSSRPDALVFCAPILQTKLPVSDFAEEAVVEDVSKVLGAAYIEMSTKTLTLRREQAIWRALLITLGILLLAALLARRTAYHIAKPIEQLTDTVKQVEQGELDVYVASGLSNEIGSLQHGVNSMITALKQHRDHLEELIEERTMELTRQTEEAEQANIAKSKFLAAASHDLRQPLHALRLFLDILNTRLRGSGLQPIMENINKSTEALGNLFDNLLDLSKVEAKAITPEYSDFPLQYIFNRLMTDYASSAYGKGLWFRMVPTKAIVHSDIAMLERILRNLVSNAIRYTNEGGVLIGCRRRNGMLEIEVWDTGIGIPENEMESIFSEFHQVDNPERDRNKGLGLGLAIAQGLAQLLNQNLKVSSKLGKGSCFSIEVPFGSQELIDIKHEQSQITGTELTGSSVIFIDDDKTIREAMKQLLVDWACDSIIEEDFEKALQRVENSNRIPDIIITDYRLRNGFNGCDAINKLREKFGHNIPAIIITGDTAAEWIRDVESKDCQVLFKPLNTEKLYKVMGKIMQAASSE